MICFFCPHCRQAKVESMPAHADVVTILRRCGMTAAQANAFANQHGVNSLTDCMLFWPEMAKSMINDFNNGRALNQKMGVLNTLKLCRSLYLLAKGFAGQTATRGSR